MSSQGGFSFGQPKIPTTTSAQQPAATGFGFGAAPSFGFGGANTTAPAVPSFAGFGGTQTQAPAATFGQQPGATTQSTQQASGGFSFGGLKIPSTTTASTGFAFGANPSFGFGSSTTTATAPTAAPTVPSFGASTVSGTSTVNPFGGFGSTPAPAAAPFGQQTAPAAQSTQPTTGMTFTGLKIPTTTSGQQPTATGFGFGTTPTFGSSTSTAAAAPVVPAFGGIGGTTAPGATMGQKPASQPSLTGGFTGSGSKIMSTTISAPQPPMTTAAGFGFGATPSSFGFGSSATTAAAPAPAAVPSIGSTVSKTTTGLGDQLATASPFGIFGSTPAPAAPFGQTAQSTTSGQQPTATGFGLGTIPTFGTATTTATDTSQPAAGISFGQKIPSTTSAQQPTATGFGFGTVPTFGSTTSTAAAPTGLGGTTAQVAPFGQKSTTIQAPQPSLTGGFSVSGSKVPSTTSAQQPATTGFGFGFGTATTATAPVAPTVSTATTTGQSDQIATASPFGAFGSTAAPAATFGQQTQTAPAAPAATFGQPTAPIQPSSQPSAEMTFGGLKIPSTTSAPQPTATGFSLSATSSFGAASTTATTAAPVVPPFGTAASFGQKPATTVQVSQPSVTSGGQPAATGAPKPITYQQLEELINRWTMDLEEQERLFLTQATQINAWDRVLMENSDKILKLCDDVNGLDTEQRRVDYELDFVAQQQSELGQIVDQLEKSLAVEDIVGGFGHHSDARREEMVQLQSTIDCQLKQVGRDVGTLVERINSAHQTGSDVDPFKQIAAILSKQMDSLQWLDGQIVGVERRTLQLQTEVDKRRNDHQKI